MSNGSDYGGGEIPDHSEGDGYAAPAMSWTPSISPGSLMVYGGDLFTDWQGDAFLGALSGEALVRVDLDGTSAGEAEVYDLGERIRAVEEGPGRGDLAPRRTRAPAGCCASLRRPPDPAGTTASLGSNVDWTGLRTRGGGHIPMLLNDCNP